MEKNKEAQIKNVFLVAGGIVAVVVVLMLVSSATTGYAFFGLFGEDSESSGGIDGGYSLEAVYNEVHASDMRRSDPQNCEDISVSKKIPERGKISLKKEDIIDCSNKTITVKQCAKEIIGSFEKISEEANDACEEELEKAAADIDRVRQEFEKDCNEKFVQLSGESACEIKTRDFSPIGSCNIHDGCVLSWLGNRKSNGEYEIKGKCILRKRAGTKKGLEVIPLGSDWKCWVQKGEKYKVECTSSDSFVSFKGECVTKESAKGTF